MQYNKFVFEVYVNNTSISLLPSDISFSMQDSIWDFYPISLFSFIDSTGLVFEGKGLTEGMPVTLDYGTDEKEDSIQCPYVVKNTEMPETKTTGLINGEVKGTNIHRYRTKQTIESKAYSGAISDIVEEVIEDETFDEILIDNSENNGIWYRPLLTQEQFIEEILLENVYSRNSDSTPYFCFIDSKNRFHFQHYKTLYNQNVKAKLIYKSIGIEGVLDKNTIMSISPFSADLDSYYPVLKRKIFTFSDEDGSISEEDDLITEHPPISGNKFPFVGDTSIYTGYQDLNILVEEAPYNENILGQRIFKLRPAMNIERFLITTPLHTEILSGDCIEIQTPTLAPDKEKKSEYHSGKYLVERSNHKWLGKKSIGLSQFVISRQTVNVVENYAIKSMLYS